MESLIQVIGWADVVVFSALSVVSITRWRRDGGAPVGWLSATFAVLALVLTVSVVTPDDSDTGGDILSKVVLATDTEGRIAFWNRAAEDIFGYLEGRGHRSLSSDAYARALQSQTRARTR